MWILEHNVKERPNPAEKDQTLWRDTVERDQTTPWVISSFPYPFNTNLPFPPGNFKHGFALQTLLSIIILCAKVSIVGLQVGLSKATHFKDGRRTASRRFPTKFFRKSRTLKPLWRFRPS